MISSDIPETEVFYSTYGYVQVSRTEYDSPNSMVKFTKGNTFSGSLHKTQLSKAITIHLKTFYGQRKKYSLQVGIDECIFELIYKLISSEVNQSTMTFNINWQYRLMSSLSNLRELNIYRTYAEENIKDGEILVILSPQTFKFSEIMKAPHIYLEGKSKIATKNDTDENEFCLAEPGFKYGKRYIEFTLESEPFEKNIMIGVSIYRTTFSFNNSLNFYGYLLSDCQIIFNSNNQMETRDYGSPTKIGDKIGMLIELTQNEREVTYFVNNVQQGFAFRDLPLEVFYPCVCLGFPGTRVKMNSKVDFPS